MTSQRSLLSCVDDNTHLSLCSRGEAYVVWAVRLSVRLAVCLPPSTRNGTSVAGHINNHSKKTREREARSINQKSIVSQLFVRVRLSFSLIRSLTFTNGSDSVSRTILHESTVWFALSIASTFTPPLSLSLSSNCCYCCLRISQSLEYTKTLSHTLTHIQIQRKVASLVFARFFSHSLCFTSHSTLVTFSHLLFCFSRSLFCFFFRSDSHFRSVCRKVRKWKVSISALAKGEVYGIERGERDREEAKRRGKGRMCSWLVYCKT